MFVYFKVRLRQDNRVYLQFIFLLHLVALGWTDQTVTKGIVMAIAALLT